MRIKELCPDERPREKMRLRGAKALSNADLLAILLGSGTGGRSVIDVAQELMVSAGGRLSLLGVMPLEKLVSHKGVGEARAITIAAALELGRRALEEQVLVDKRAITSPEMVYQLMLPQLKNLDHEECWVLYLNRSNFLIGREMISSGTLESTPIDAARLPFPASSGTEPALRDLLPVIERNAPRFTALAVREVAMKLMDVAVYVLVYFAGAVWLAALSANFPVALGWQLLVAGPLVRYLFPKLNRAIARL